MAEANLLICQKLLTPSDNGDTQAHCSMTQSRTTMEEEWEKDGGLGLFKKVA